MQPLMIVRYGGYGDHIVWSSVLPFLEKKHHPIRLEASPQGVEIFLRDPRFEYLSVFDLSDVTYEEERSIMAINRWDKIREDCNRLGMRYLNFWSSMENTAVLCEAHQDVKLTREERESKYNINFYDNTFKMAEVTMPSGWIHRNTLRFSDAEINVVKRWRQKQSGNFCVLVTLGGSARQKVYPTWIKSFCNRLVDDFPRLKLYLVGGIELAKDTWTYKDRVIPCCGTMPYRQAILMTRFADYVFGADTGLSIAAGMMGTPKSILFTLTNKDQLVKYHENDFSLQSKTTCSPCYVMAYNGDICPVEPVYNKFPLCTHEFDLDELYGHIQRHYTKRF